jgi:hypothetical protein
MGPKADRDGTLDTPAPDGTQGRELSRDSGGRRSEVYWERFPDTEDYRAL